MPCERRSALSIAVLYGGFHRRLFPCGRHPCCYHGLMTIRRFVRFAAWTGLALIVFVTLVPIEARPPTITSNHLDRALAFLGMSALFVIAYPRRVLSITVVLFFAAFVIELVQFASKTRHPEFQDAVVKALGVLVGVAAGWFTNYLSRRGTKSP